MCRTAGAGTTIKELVLHSLWASFGRTVQAGLRRGCRLHAVVLSASRGSPAEEGLSSFYPLSVADSRERDYGSIKVYCTVLLS